MDTSKDLKKTDVKADERYLLCEKIQGQYIQVTPLEYDMLKKIALNEYTTLNGAEPDTADQSSCWMDCIVESKSDGAIFISLSKKGLINYFKDKEEPRESICELTNLGLAAYKKITANEKKGKEFI
ncbi:MAG: hypothetical protein WC175_06600 [Candidatus Dojkabacteria bacterium]